MFRVTLSDLSRVPVERLAQLLMERAAEDRTLLSRLEATISEANVARSADGGDRSVPTPSGDVKSDLIGQSIVIRRVADLLRRFAQTDEPVLITGESGTGKELAARAD